MIPIRLKIQGLYSYREEVEIDFVKLAEGQLFGIFGAVGSGKSAILEAIAYVLYGQTERLNLSGDNRNYNMMNLQSQEMFIEFEFLAAFNNNEERYLFRVKQKRNSKKFGSVGSPTRTALQWRNGEWEPLENTNARPILRLSYENFIKTIIIPQGKFQDFLHMGATHRTRMLREIFSLDRFELDRPTKVLKAAASESLVRLEEQLKPLDEASEEVIQVKVAELKALEEELVRIKAQELQLQTAATQQRQLKALSEKIVATKKQFEALIGQKSEFEARDKQLQQYQMVRLEFSELLNQSDRLAKELKQAEGDFTLAETSLKQVLPQLEEAKATRIKAKEAWEGRGDLEVRIQDCEQLISLHDAEKNIKTYDERLAKGREMKKSIDADILKAEKAIEQCDAALASNKKLLPDVALIGEVQLWFQQRDQLSKQLNASIKEIEAGRVGSEKLVGELQMLAKAQGIEPSENEKLLDQLQGIANLQKAKISASREKRDQVQRHGGLATFSSDLKDGAPCPLCGAAHHPVPFDAGEVDSQLQQATSEIQLAEAKLDQTEKAILEAQGLSIRLEENKKQLEALEAEKMKFVASSETHLQAFKWDAYSPEKPEKLEADRQAAIQFQEIIAKEENVRKDLEQSLKTFQANQKKFEEGLNTLKEAQNRFVGQRDTHLSQIAVLKEEAYLKMPEAELKALSAKYEASLKAIQSAFEESQKKEKALEIQVAEWQLKRSKSEEAHKRLKADSDENHAQLEVKMQKANFVDLGELRQILAEKLDVASAQAAIQQFKDQLLAVETTLKTLEAEAQSQKYDAEAHEKAEEALAAAKLKIEAQQKAQSLLQAAITKLQADFARRKDLEIQQANVQKRFDNLKLLEGMFKASGFVKYVSTIYLQELVNRADVRFRKLTRNALSLELGDESDFLVRDMLNGGQTRSVKTLSGGQTFQASLCLALALADNVQQHSGSSHNFFFLDEGFGTLDKESLTAVFDALKQLRQENRTVGVISHVEDLQQEIDTHLKVWQTEARGSLVKGSWE